VLVSLWSLKGGSGCSVSAALLALQRSRHDPGGVVLVDLGRDQPRVLGCAEPMGPGASDWFNLGPSGPPDGVARLAVEVAPGLGLVWRGKQDWSDDDRDVDTLLGPLAEHPGHVIVDAGCVMDDSPRARVARLFAAYSTRSILVTRACYLSLSRAAAAPVSPSAVLLLRERDRSLTSADVEAAVRAPVVAELDVDPGIARAVDAGLLLARPPRGLGRTLDAVA